MPESTDDWLLSIDQNGRVLNDPVEAIDQLDEITVKKRSRPTVGWMQRNTCLRKT